MICIGKQQHRNIYVERIYSSRWLVNKMDPVGIAVLGSACYAIISHALSGVVGNTADRAVLNAYRALREKINENKAVNHDLQKMVFRSFIRALSSICDECYEKLEKTNDNKKDMDWLKKKKKELKEKLEKSDNMEYIETPVESLQEIESFILPTGELNQEKLKKVKEKLNEMAITGRAIPECYKEEIEKTLFERMCAYFIDEFKKNENARHIFEGQILALIHVELGGQKLTLDIMLKSLNEIAEKAVPQIIKEIREGVKSIEKKIEKESNEIKMEIKDTKEQIMEIREYMDGLAKYVLRSEDEKVSELVEKGDEYFQKGMFDVAEDFYKLALNWAKKAPGVNKKHIVVCMYELGAAIGMQNRHTESLEYFNEVIKLDPENHMGWYNKGIALYFLGEYKNTISACQKAIEYGTKAEKWGTVASAYNNMGTVLARLTKYEEAIEEYQKSLALRKYLPDKGERIFPQIPTLCCSVGLVSMKNNDIDTAQRYAKVLVGVCQEAKGDGVLGIVKDTVTKFENTLKEEDKIVFQKFLELVDGCK